MSLKCLQPQYILIFFNAHQIHFILICPEFITNTPLLPYKNLLKLTLLYVYKYLFFSFIQKVKINTFTFFNKIFITSISVNLNHSL